VDINVLNFGNLARGSLDPVYAAAGGKQKYKEADMNLLVHYLANTVGHITLLCEAATLNSRENLEQVRKNGWKALFSCSQNLCVLARGRDTSFSLLSAVRLLDERQPAGQDALRELPHC
jgi:hypothetical protein